MKRIVVALIAVIVLCASVCCADILYSEVLTLDIIAEPEAVVIDEADVSADVTAEETAAEGTEPEEAETEPEKSLAIYAEYEGKLRVGTPVTLYASVEGYEAGTYTLQWYCSADGSSWNAIDGANGSSYSLVMSEQNDKYYWKAVLTVNA